MFGGQKNTAKRHETKSSVPLFVPAQAVSPNCTSEEFHLRQQGTPLIIRAHSPAKTSAKMLGGAKWYSERVVMRRLDQRIVSESVEEKWNRRLLRYGDRFSRACEATREKFISPMQVMRCNKPRFQQIPHSHMYVAVADACSHRAIAKQVSGGFLLE